MSGGANCPETPRQKMIGMMYLFLTAMLALNVSKDILNAFVVVNNGLEETNTNFDNKIKSAAEQQNNGCHLCQDSSSLSVKDSRFFKDFQIFFHGAVGSFGGRANFLNQVVTF